MISPFTEAERSQSLEPGEYVSVVYYGMNRYRARLIKVSEKSAVVEFQPSTHTEPRTMRVDPVKHKVLPCCTEDADAIINLVAAADSLRDLAEERASSYCPSFGPEFWEQVAANAYDNHQAQRRDARRARRWGLAKSRRLNGQGTDIDFKTQSWASFSQLQAARRVRNGGRA